MADNAILYKYLAKSVGMRHGVLPSFMAKPWGNVRTPFFTLILLRVYRPSAQFSFQDAVGKHGYHFPARSGFLHKLA